MRSKILFLMFVFVLCTCNAYGASDDIYLRQDVFDAKMDALYNKLHGEILELKTELKGDIKALSERIDGNYRTLDKRIDSLDNHFYIIMAFLGVIIAMPFVQKELKEHKEKQAQSLSIDNIKNLINDAIRANNLSVQGK